MHAERDIVLATPSVCPLNTGIVSKQMHISSHFFDVLVGHHSSFWASALLQNSKGNQLSGALNICGVVEFCKCRFLSWKNTR